MVSVRRVALARPSLRTSTRAALMTGLLTLTAQAALAVPMKFDVVGDQDSNHRGAVIFAYNAAAGRIDITVTNTTQGQGNPKITGFTFNLPTGVTGTGALQATDSWKELLDRDKVDTPGQFGFFDIAALSGPNFQQGDASKGFGKGQTRTYSFTLQGTSLASLTEASFLNLLSKDESPAKQTFFAVRFQQGGARGAGDDVAPGVAASIQAVPEPTVLALLGGAAIAAIMKGKRRRAKG